MPRFAGDFRRAGFSFTELTVAIALLAGAMVPLFVMQGRASSRARASQPELFATALAAEVADQLRTLPFAALPVAGPLRFEVGRAGPPPAVVLPGEPAVPLLLGDYPFRAAVTVTVEPMDPPDVLARMTIDVTWEGEPAGGAPRYRLVELVENRAVAVGDE